MLDLAAEVLCGRRRRRNTAGVWFRGGGLAGDAQIGAPGVNPTRAWVGEHARGMRKALVARGRLFGARTGLVAERGGASSPASGVVRAGTRYGLH